MVAVSRSPEAKLPFAGLPELDEPGWTSDDFIRDFPVDFTLVLTNVADPDHGIFAHQTPIFDSFAASAEYPMQVTTEPGRAGPKASQHCRTDRTLPCNQSHAGACQQCGTAVRSRGILACMVFLALRIVTLSCTEGRFPFVWYVFRNAHCCLKFITRVARDALAQAQPYVQVIGRVPGVLKLTRKEKDKEKDKAMFGEQGKATDVVATLEFEPPTHVRWSRFDASGKTSFITAFYCSPAGDAPAS